MLSIFFVLVPYSYMTCKSIPKLELCLKVSSENSKNFRRLLIRYYLVVCPISTLIARYSDPAKRTLGDYEIYCLIALHLLWALPSVNKFYLSAIGFSLWSSLHQLQNPFPSIQWLTQRWAHLWLATQGKLIRILSWICCTGTKRKKFSIKWDF